MQNGYTTTNVREVVNPHSDPANRNDLDRRSNSGTNPKQWGKAPRTRLRLVLRPSTWQRPSTQLLTPGHPTSYLDIKTRPIFPMSKCPPGDSPFAILKAANGGLLDSIGRGMLTIRTVTVVAYIFKDNDLVHNLLGIAPFADRGCKATFDATQFHLYHLDRTPILLGTRHAQNLWRIDMPDRQEPSQHIPAYGVDKVVLLHHPSDTDAEHIRFVHASRGSSPPPSTFFKAVARGYITGPRQFPRLNTKNVRRRMPNSIAMARGHLRKSRTSQPHAQSQSVRV
jgi:hypothetical protein